MSKVEEVYSDTPEGEKQIRDFNFDNYDYRLKFEGAKDILFARESNAVWFEGEKRLYFLWGSADNLWDSLVFDDAGNTVDICGEKIRVMTNVYNEDVDGDGKAENIELIYERGRSEDFKGDLIISINGSKAFVMKGYDWFTKPYYTILQMPEIKFLPEQGGKRKAVLVIYTWATNGIGSTGDVNAYSYTDGHISEIRINDAERNIKYKGDNIVNIEFPAFNRSTDVLIDTEHFMGFFGDKESFKQELESKEAFLPHPLWYTVNDYNGDGQEDLCCVSVLSSYPFSLCSQYSYYEYEGGELDPVQAFVVSFNTDDERKYYLKDHILILIHQKGYLTIADSGVAEENVKPPYDYTPDEIFGMLEELQKDNILEIKGDRLYIDY